MNNIRSIYLLIPWSEEARAWIEENVDYEGYQMVGQGIGVEHRYIKDLVRGMQECGLQYGEDFIVD